MDPTGKYNLPPSFSEGGTRVTTVKETTEEAVQCAEGNSSLSQIQAQAIFLSNYLRYASLKTGLAF
jgi:hypothetical protein